MSKSDEPVFVVKLNGMYKDVDLERHAERYKSELPGRVVVVDGRVDDIYKLTEQDVTRLVRVLEGTAMADRKFEVARSEQ